MVITHRNPSISVVWIICDVFNLENIDVHAESVFLPLLLSLFSALPCRLIQICQCTSSDTPSYSPFFVFFTSPDISIHLEKQLHVSLQFGVSAVGVCFGSLHLANLDFSNTLAALLLLQAGPQDCNLPLKDVIAALQPAETP